jgi:hypothetical protein
LRLHNIAALLAILLLVGGAFYFMNGPKAVVQKTQVYAWDINMDNIEHVTIKLPRTGQSESFIKIPNEDKFPWFFDDANKSPVDSKIWGGGIPLLLSGPGVMRVIANNCTAAELESYGMTTPRCEIILTMSDGAIKDIKVGDRSPDSGGDYIQPPNTSDIAKVDYSWYDVMARLVTSPPHITTTTTPAK